MIGFAFCHHPRKPFYSRSDSLYQWWNFTCASAGCFGEFAPYRGKSLSKGSVCIWETGIFLLNNSTPNTDNIQWCNASTQVDSWWPSSTFEIFTEIRSSTDGCYVELFDWLNETIITNAVRWQPKHLIDDVARWLTNRNWFSRFCVTDQWWTLCSHSCAVDAGVLIYRLCTPGPRWLNQNWTPQGQ